MKKRLFASVLLCSLTLSAIATPSIALADNVDKKIEEKNQEISSLKAKQGDLASQVSSLEAEVSSVFDESMALREQKQTLKAKSEQLQQEITNLNITCLIFDCFVTFFNTLIQVCNFLLIKKLKKKIKKFHH